MKIAVGKGLGLAALLAKGIIPDIIISPEKSLLRDNLDKIYPKGSDGDEMGGLNIWGGALGWPTSQNDITYFTHLSNILKFMGWKDSAVERYIDELRSNIEGGFSLSPYIDTGSFLKEFKCRIRDIPTINAIVESFKLETDNVIVKYTNGSNSTEISAKEIYLCCGNLQTVDILSRSSYLGDYKHEPFIDTEIGKLGKIILKDPVKNSFFNNVHIEGIRHRRIFQNKGSDIACYFIPGLNNVSFEDLICLKKALSGDFRFIKRLASKPIYYLAILFKLVKSEFFTKESKEFFIWINKRPVSDDILSTFLQSLNSLPSGVYAQKVEVIEDPNAVYSSAFHLRGDLLKLCKDHPTGVHEMETDSRVKFSSLAIVDDHSCRNPGVKLF